MKENKICKECGKTFKPCHPTSVFCSKACATKYRNIQKMLDRSHNFYKLDRSKIALDRVKQGIHPFQAGNMSQEALEKKAKGIKEARIREAKEHKHPWQKPENYIENEYSRSLSRARARNLSEIHLYIAKTDFPNTFKIGWTADINMREKDNRTHHICNLTVLLTGPIDWIISIEKETKTKFFNEMYYENYHSTEIFPDEIKQTVIDFINSLK